MATPSALPRGEQLRALIDAPRSARLEAIVVRLPSTDGAPRHQTPARAELTPEAGLVGDRWRDNPRLERQVTLMDARVVRLLLAERARRREPTQGELLEHEALDLPGDNLVFDLPTGAAALPPGTRLRVGAATLETNDVPHRGCKKFEARFGADALAWVNDPALWDLRLRGIHAVVVEGGAIALGDEVHVLGGDRVDGDDHVVARDGRADHDDDDDRGDDDARAA